MNQSALNNGKFMRLAIEEARKTILEKNGKAHPRVGAVIVSKDGRLLAKGHKGEKSMDDHAEYTILVEKLKDVDVAGGTLYTTLEPCISRVHGIPCAEIIVQKKIARVQVGILDPNPLIRGLGVYELEQKGVRVDILYDPELKKEIRELNKDFTELHRNVSAPRSVPEILYRGEVFDDLVDAVFSLDTHRISMKEDILQSILSGRLVPPKYQYITEEGANAFLDLCQDPEYRYYRETTQFVADKRDEVIDTVREHVGSNAFDLISMGPGNGRKDALLLNSVAAGLEGNQTVYYYPFDASRFMLSEATSVVQSRGPDRTNLRIKAILGEFSDVTTFQSVFDYRRGRNVFSLLGVLGNMPEDLDFLIQIGSVMGQGDVLLLETRRKSDGVKLDGNEAANARFDVTPLQCIGLDVKPGKVHYSDEKGRSRIPDTSSIVGGYEGLVVHGMKTDKALKRTLLSYVHYYDPSRLKSALESAGFMVLKEYAERNFLFVIAGKSHGTEA